MVHICRGPFSAVLWPRMLLLFSNSPVMTPGTSWPNKWNSRKQRQPKLLTQAFCHGKSAFAASTLSNRRGTEREVTHCGNSSLSRSGSFLHPPVSGLCRSGSPAVGHELHFPGSISLCEHTPGSSCCLLPESRLPPPLPKKKKSFTAFWGSYSSSFF